MNIERVMKDLSQELESVKDRIGRCQDIREYGELQKREHRIQILGAKLIYHAIKVDYVPGDHEQTYSYAALEAT